MIHYTIFYGFNSCSKVSRKKLDSKLDEGNIFNLSRSTSPLHFNGVHQGVDSFEMPSLSPLLSIIVSSFVGANLSSFVDLSKLSYLIVLAM